MDAPSISSPTTFAEATVRLSTTLPGYEERPEQTRLATAIEQTIQDGSILLAQAGTGTGKSLAALIPSILSGETVVYSTASKALQSQIVDKDLPFLAANLGVDFKYAMLQGRKNYLCRERLLNADDLDPSDKRVLVESLADLDRDLEESPADWVEGLRDDFPAVDDRTWRSVTVGSDDCLGKECPFFKECFVTQAKERAAAANVVVVNHALLVSDAVVRQKTDGEVGILPSYSALVVDEAHELEEYATSALGTELRPGTVPRYVQDLTALIRRNDPDLIEEAEEIRNELSRASGALFFLLDGLGPERIRHRWFTDNSEAFFAVMDQVGRALQLLNESWERMNSKYAADVPRKIRNHYLRTIRRTANLRASFQSFLLLTDADVVRFTEKTDRGDTILKMLPVRCGPWLSENLWPGCTPVLLSATLFVDGSADYVIDRYGLDLSEREVRMIDSGTPFNYDEQLVLYVPGHIAEPTPKLRERWTEEMIPIVIELIKSSRGRALVLFTSAKQMREVHRQVARHISDFPVKVQGDDTTANLTRWFRETVEGVLFATRTFFTGIDVQGESLSLVIIDKLPFPVPTDPVIEARSEDMESRGLNPFSDYTVPVMALTLLQAHGRLIRTKKDKGVVAILDPRLWSKGYGKKIMRSLPGRHSRDLNDVDRIFS